MVAFFLLRSAVLLLVVLATLLLAFFFSFCFFFATASLFCTRLHHNHNQRDIVAKHLFVAAIFCFTHFVALRISNSFDWQRGYLDHRTCLISFSLSLVACPDQMTGRKDKIQERQVWNHLLLVLVFLSLVSRLSHDWRCSCCWPCSALTCISSYSPNIPICIIFLFIRCASFRIFLLRRCATCSSFVSLAFCPLLSSSFKLALCFWTSSSGHFWVRPPLSFSVFFCLSFSFFSQIFSSSSSLRWCFLYSLLSLFVCLHHFVRFCKLLEFSILAPPTRKYFPIVAILFFISFFPHNHFDFGADCAFCFLSNLKFWLSLINWFVYSFPINHFYQQEL